MRFGAVLAGLAVTLLAGCVQPYYDPYYPGYPAPMRPYDLPPRYRQPEPPQTYRVPVLPPEPAPYPPPLPPPPEARPEPAASDSPLPLIIVPPEPAAPAEPPPRPAEPAPPPPPATEAPPAPARTPPGKTAAVPLEGFRPMHAQPRPTP